VRVQLKLSRDVRWSVRDTARRSDRYDGDPDLVARDENGEVYIVRYEAVNAMLLNEFLKEHRRVEEQRAYFELKLAQQQKQIEALTATIQKVSDQVALSRPAPQLVANH